jgi:tripartite-type tricarboxylate transporter receptor subunit TctC
VINDKLPYDAARDVVPISPACEIFIPIAASKSLNVGSLPELVRLARAQPGKVNWAASPGLPQYVFSAFLKNASLDMTPVFYRDLTSAVQDLGEGRLQVSAISVTLVLPLAHAGKATLLAMANGRRAPIAPAIPTVIEAGHPELAMDGFAGFFGWRDMPDELRERIAADVRAVAAEPDVQARLANVGQAARASTPTEFAFSLADARARIAAIVRIVGARPTQ